MDKPTDKGETKAYIKAKKVERSRNHLIQSDTRIYNHSKKICF